MSYNQAKAPIGTIDPNPSPIIHPVIGEQTLHSEYTNKNQKEEYEWNTIWCQKRNGVIAGCVGSITDAIHNRTVCNIRSI